MKHFTLNRTLLLSMMVSATCVFPAKSLAQNYGGTAYNGPHNISGAKVGHASVVEAEDYDTGGEGTSYHFQNTKANMSVTKAYRKDGDAGVAIADHTPSGSTEKLYAVGSTTPGDWLAYTIEVDADGYYSIATKCSAGGQGRYSLYVDDVKVVDSRSFKNGNWRNYTDDTVTGIKLTKGTHIFKWEQREGMNVDKFTFTFAGEHQYYNAIPGRICCYMYDELTADNHNFANKDKCNANCYKLRADGRDDCLAINGSGTDADPYVIKNTTPGDFWEYTVYAEEGTYDIAIRAIGANSGEMIKLWLDGEQIGKNLSCPGGWAFADAKDTKVEGVSISEGKHVLKFEIAKGSNLYWLEFTKTSTTGIDNATTGQATPTAGNHWYTIGGQRVATPTKGLYIHNGKKVLIK